MSYRDWTVAVWALAGLVLATALLPAALVRAQGAASTITNCSAPDAPIDDDLAPAVDSIDVTEERIVIDVEVELDIAHTWIGDLQLDLESPLGTEVRLHDRGGGLQGSIELTYSDTGVAHGTEAYDCLCRMRPAGPGRFADFDGESTFGAWSLTAADVEDGDEGTLNEWCLAIEPAPHFLRGDADGNGEVSALVDARYLLEWQFLSEPAPVCVSAADVDDDGRILAIKDAVHLLRWQFASGPEPAAPGPSECGDDPTSDALDCAAPSAGCE